MEKLLYHYGSNRRCFGILSAKAFRMSDIRKSNDSNELLLLYPGIFDELYTQYCARPFPISYNGKENELAMKEIIEGARELLNEALSCGTFSNYVICFSEKSDVLSQWRGYATDGKGCCLGFSLEKLLNYCNQSDGVLRLEKVTYVTPQELSELTVYKAKGILRTLQSLSTSVAEKTTECSNYAYLENLLVYYLNFMVEEALTDSLQYKHIGFAEEHEWRMYLCEQAYKWPELAFTSFEFEREVNRMAKTLSFLNNNIEFNITEDNLSPYIPVKFKDFDSSPVCEVWLGPKSQISTGDLKLYLTKYGYTEVVIKKSVLSYR